ncbi:hypothetical protein BCR36DRAFT_413594 [Piromyces finnis]|uniref:NudC domain-containing protein 1 n=1 Tax=Piromyces finnis TaxID=1754191 RepID=A0A1Y1V5I5_9FUNG|nr:hypothetical protein BCR36DRAFT_413594 [Piromyces finnis]|eukprot:ORX47654.1 hypothetical protein BCR36DRAFT_413594 [Piromyces finnis]
MKNNPTNRQIKVNRNLYNPKFEGYKLNLNTDIQIIHHNLPSKVDVNCIKTYSHTPYKIIEARNRLNFVFQNPWYSYSFFYIDESYSLIYILIDEVTFEATYYNLFQIEEPADEDKNEYPTVVFVNENLLVLSDGAFNGKIYVLNFNNENKVVTIKTIISKRKLLEENNFYEQNVYPVNLMYAKLSCDKQKIYILGYTYNSSSIISNLTTFNKSKKTKLEFYVSLCEITIGSSSIDIDSGNTISSNLKLISATKCNNSPTYGSIEDYITETVESSSKTNIDIINEGNYMIVSENDAFQEYISIVNNDEKDKKVDNENLSNKESMIIEKQDKQLQNQIPKHTTLYKWYQEMDDITLYFHLFELEKNRVQCKFTKNKIILNVLNRNNEIIEIFNDELWDEVIPEECVWTIERSRNKSGSIITLHLEKKNQVRWIQMFKEDDHVLETVDPSELANIKERLLMFTGNDDEDQGLYPKINSIQQTEECDMEKSPISFVRLSKAGHITDINQGSGFEWLCTSFPTLDSPYFMSDNDNCVTNSQEPSVVSYLCLKQDVDGIILKPEDHLKMNHCAVFNAFGFVEASKRNKKFAYISNDFEYALISETSKLVYVYGQPTDEEAKRNSASQYLIDVSNPDSQVITDEDQKEELIHGIAQLDRHTFMVLKRSSFCIFFIRNE